MQSPLLRNSGKKKILSESDILRLKHDFIKTYGYYCWQNIGLDEFFELLPELEKEIAKQEHLRLCTLKFYGVKNPK